MKNHFSWHLCVMTALIQSLHFPGTGLGIKGDSNRQTLIFPLQNIFSYIVFFLDDIPFLFINTM